VGLPLYLAEVSLHNLEVLFEVGSQIQPPFIVRLDCCGQDAYFKIRAAAENPRPD